MRTKKITITFEVDAKKDTFDQASGVKESLHEALCQAIHEPNKKAWQWLFDSVVDIRCRI